MRACWILVVLASLVPSVAAAETLEADRYEPARELELLGLQGIDLDTNWQPPGSPIQVRFLTHADDNIVVEMPGDAVLDWDTGEVYFTGDEDGGVFDVDIGVALDARFRFDLLGQQFESSLIGPYDLGIFREASFTPYLLPGNDHRPVQIDDETTPIEVFNYAIVDALIASGNFFVDAAFDIEMELSCEAIDVLDPDGVDVGSIVAEFEALAAADPDAALVELQASLHCTLVSDVDLLLYPGVELQIGFQEFQLAPFELRIPLLSDRTDALDFEALPISFDMPPEEEPEGSTGEATEGGSGGDEGSSEGGESGAGDASSGTGGGSGMQTSGSSGDAATLGDASSGSSGGAGANDASSSEGCACTSGGGSAPIGGLLGFGLLLGARRRRLDR